MALNFDALPEVVRVDIFLLLGPSDLNTCMNVSKPWKDFIKNEIILSSRNKGKMATYRHVFGKVVTNNEVDVDSLWMLASHDPVENKLYILSKPATGDDWILKQYDGEDLHELKSVVLVTAHFVRNMQAGAGHLVLFKQARENGNNFPAVINIDAIPWGGRLPIENGIQLPNINPVPHVRKLLLGQDSFFLVSKNAHVTFSSANGAFTDETHDAFVEDFDRPVVVQKLDKESGVWQEVARLHPEHSFKIMEKFSHVPSSDTNHNHRDEACLLYLNDKMINNRCILVSCPLHGSYECFDVQHDFSMWRFNTTPLPFENIRTIMRDSQSNSSSVLAAIRDAYVMIYSEIGKATLLSVEDGKLLCHVPGEKFVLSPRYVLPVEHGGKKKGYDITVMNPATGEASSTFTFQRMCLTMDAFGDKPWHHDDQAYSDFEGIAKQLLPVGPKRPIFERKAETYWGFGHSMVDATRMLCWARQTSKKFKIKLATFQLDGERFEVAPLEVETA